MPSYETWFGKVEYYEPININQIYNNHWIKLHTYKPKKWIIEEVENFYDIWESEIPSLSCTCKDNWKKIVIDNPPNFSSYKEFILWGWQRHNDVNTKLGKPIFSWEEFIQKYDFQENFDILE